MQNEITNENEDNKISFLEKQEKIKQDKAELGEKQTNLEKDEVKLKQEKIKLGEKQTNLEKEKTNLKQDEVKLKENITTFEKKLNKSEQEENKLNKLKQKQEINEFQQKQNESEQKINESKQRQNESKQRQNESEQKINKSKQKQNEFQLKQVELDKLEQKQVKLQNKQNQSKQEQNELNKLENKIIQLKQEQNKLEQEQSEFKQEQDKFKQEQSEFKQEQSEFKQEQDEFEQKQSEFKKKEFLIKLDRMKNTLENMSCVLNLNKLKNQLKEHQKKIENIKQQPQKKFALMPLPEFSAPTKEQQIDEIKNELSLEEIESKIDNFKKKLKDSNWSGMINSNLEDLDATLNARIGQINSLSEKITETISFLEKNEITEETTNCIEDLRKQIDIMVIEKAKINAKSQQINLIIYNENKNEKIDEETENKKIDNLISHILKHETIEMINNDIENIKIINNNYLNQKLNQIIKGNLDNYKISCILRIIDKLNMIDNEEIIKELCSKIEKNKNEKYLNIATQIAILYSLVKISLKDTNLLNINLQNKIQNTIETGLQMIINYISFKDRQLSNFNNSFLNPFITVTHFLNLKNELPYLSLKMNKPTAQDLQMIFDHTNKESKLETNFAKLLLKVAKNKIKQEIPLSSEKEIIVTVEKLVKAGEIKDKKEYDKKIIQKKNLEEQLKEQKEEQEILNKYKKLTELKLKQLQLEEKLQNELNKQNELNNLNELKNLNEEQKNLKQKRNKLNKEQKKLKQKRKELNKEQANLIENEQKNKRIEAQREIKNALSLNNKKKRKIKEKIKEIKEINEEKNKINEEIKEMDKKINEINEVYKQQNVENSVVKNKILDLIQKTNKLESIENRFNKFSTAEKEIEEQIEKTNTEFTKLSSKITNSLENQKLAKNLTIQYKHNVDFELKHNGKTYYIELDGMQYHNYKKVFINDGDYEIIDDCNNTTKLRNKFIYFEVKKLNKDENKDIYEFIVISSENFNILQEEIKKQTKNEKSFDINNFVEKLLEYRYKEEDIEQEVERKKLSVAEEELKFTENTENSQLKQ